MVMEKVGNQNYSRICQFGFSFDSMGKYMPVLPLVQHIAVKVVKMSWLCLVNVVIKMVFILVIMLVFAGI